mmetsp:Transcript_4368/g.5030  ORF Transcript_4368/g.5030 Transcript_4368/m.5030 type:complete len:110 (-) Transcript_4368:45-374(-)
MPATESTDSAWRPTVPVGHTGTSWGGTPQGVNDTAWGPIVPVGHTGISWLGGTPKAKKATRAATAPIADVKTYLQGTVREELAKALLEMQRTKPDDPFGFLSNFFKRRN